MKITQFPRSHESLLGFVLRYFFVFLYFSLCSFIFSNFFYFSLFFFCFPFSSIVFSGASLIFPDLDSNDFSELYRRCWNAWQMISNRTESRTFSPGHFTSVRKTIYPLACVCVAHILLKYMFTFVREYEFLFFFSG